jgi:tetratricopeptide (TPR) repeat protein
VRSNSALLSTWLSRASQLYKLAGAAAPPAVAAEAAQLRGTLEAVLATSFGLDERTRYGICYGLGECCEAAGDAAAAAAAYVRAVAAEDAAEAAEAAASGEPPDEHSELRRAQTRYTLALAQREAGAWGAARATFAEVTALLQLRARPSVACTQLQRQVDSSLACTLQLERADRAASARAAVAALTDASSAEACKAAGNAAYAERLFADAEAAYTRGLAATQPAPALPAARAVLHANRSACRAARRMFSLAHEDAEAAVAAAPDYAKGYVRAAAALEGQHRFAAAADACRAAAAREASPAAASALLAQAEALEARERDSPAATADKGVVVSSYESSPIGALDARIARKGRERAMPPGSWARSLHDGHAVWNDALGRLVRWAEYAPEALTCGARVTVSRAELCVVLRQVADAHPGEAVLPHALLPDLLRGMLLELAGASVTEHIRGAWVDFEGYRQSLVLVCAALTASGQGVNSQLMGMPWAFGDASEDDVAGFLRKLIPGTEASMLSGVRLEATARLLQAHMFVAVGEREQAAALLRCAQRWCAAVRELWAAGRVRHSPPLGDAPPQWGARRLPVLWHAVGGDAPRVEAKFPARDAPPTVTPHAQVVDLDEEHCFFFCDALAADCWLALLTSYRSAGELDALALSTATAAMRSSGFAERFPTFAADGVVAHASLLCALGKHAAAAAAYELAAAALDARVAGAPRAFEAWSMLEASHDGRVRDVQRPRTRGARRAPKRCARTAWPPRARTSPRSRSANRRRATTVARRAAPAPGRVSWRETQRARRSRRRATAAAARTVAWRAASCCAARAAAARSTAGPPASGRRGPDTSARARRRRRRRRQVERRRRGWREFQCVVYARVRCCAHVSSSAAGGKRAGCRAASHHRTPPFGKHVTIFMRRRRMKHGGTLAPVFTRTDTMQAGGCGGGGWWRGVGRRPTENPCP